MIERRRIAGWIGRAAFFQLLIALWIGLAARPLAAQEVYRHVDQDGNVTYSTTAEAGDKPAELPQIQREDIQSKIEQIRQETPPNCSKHGGVDCSQPSDADGSVVCHDGFKDARLPYSLTCLEARLYSDLSIKIGGGGKVRLGAARGISVKDKEKIAEALENGAEMTLLVILRNMTAVAASDIGVEVRLPNRSSVALSGPAQVEPFGVAEYEYWLGQKPAAVSAQSLKRFKLSVSCRNCSSISAAPD